MRSPSPGMVGEILEPPIVEALVTSRLSDLPICSTCAPVKRQEHGSSPLRDKRADHDQRGTGEGR